MARLVDTDIFSFFFKDDTRKHLYEPHLSDQFLFLSFMTYAELRSWQIRRNWGTQLSSELELSLKRYSIQHSNKSICEIWAEIVFDSRRSGRSIAEPDAWIAATAISLDVPLVSHNAKHFRQIKQLDLITENK